MGDRDLSVHLIGRIDTNGYGFLSATVVCSSAFCQPLPPSGLRSLSPSTSPPSPSLSVSLSLNVDGAGWHNPNHEIFRELREWLGKVSLTWPSRDFPFLLNLYLLWRLTAALCRPAALLRGLATVVRPFLLTHDIFPHASASQAVVLKVHFTDSRRKSPFASWTRLSSHHLNYTCFHQNLFFSVSFLSSESRWKIWHTHTDITWHITYITWKHRINRVV